MIATVSPAPTPPLSAPAPTATGIDGDERTAFMHHTLPAGTMVGGLQIIGLIGEGGFGIVYLAFDTTLQRQVALKEYMPSTLASRASNSADVSIKSPRYLETFNAGLRSFVNEARLLAHFDHPSLVKVHQFWQANRTAYMVMPYYQGPTLKAHVSTLGAQDRRPDEGMLRQWLTPLLDALETMHGEHCYHRDIAPDNILLTSNGPLLLDFGAARRVISDMTQALTVILKPGYAPIEQYGDVASIAQGPWTDLSALASVVYYCITGHSPITSVERVMGDPLPRLARVAAGRYSTTFLIAIDSALAVRPGDRPQSVAEFRALLAGQVQPRMLSEPVAPAPPAGMPAAPAVPAAYALDQTILRTSPTQGGQGGPGYAQTMPATLPMPMTTPGANPADDPRSASRAATTFAPTLPNAPTAARTPAAPTTPVYGSPAPPTEPIPGTRMAQSANRPQGPAPVSPPEAAAPPARPVQGDAARSAPLPSTESTSRRRGALVAAVVAAAGLAIGAGFLFKRESGSAGAGGAQPPAHSAAGAASGPATAAAPLAPLAPVAPNPPAAAPATTPPPATAAAPAPAVPQATAPRNTTRPPVDPAADRAATPPRVARAPAPPPAARPAASRAAARPGNDAAARVAATPRPSPEPSPGTSTGAQAFPVPGGTTAPAPSASPAPGPNAVPGAANTQRPADTSSPPARPAPPTGGSANDSTPSAARATAPAGPSARCAELLKKGNQGTLTVEEANFLRKDCR